MGHLSKKIVYLWAWKPKQFADNYNIIGIYSNCGTYVILIYIYILILYLHWWLALCLSGETSTPPGSLGTLKWCERLRVVEQISTNQFLVCPCLCQDSILPALYSMFCIVNNIPTEKTTTSIFWILTHLLDHKLGAFGHKQFSLSQKKYQELGYYESQTLLMAAAKSKQTGDVLETIIELRADISVRSSNGSNVMFLARTPEQVHSTFDIRWLCRYCWWIRIHLMHHYDSFNIYWIFIKYSLNIHDMSLLMLYGSMWISILRPWSSPGRKYFKGPTELSAEHIFFGALWQGRTRGSYRFSNR
jgi:hypothetical protein